MRDRMIVIGALIAMLFVALQASVFGAPTIDGDLSDWGVNLQLQNTGETYNVNGQPGNYTKFVESSFEPTLGISRVVGNDNLADEHGGEFCDVEALYGALDDHNAYFAAVTSSDPNGTRWDGYGTRRFGPGDLKIKVTSSDGKTTTTYGIGARPFDLSDYGEVPNGLVPPDPRAGDRRDPATWASLDVDCEYGDTLLTTTHANVVKEPTWSYVDNPGSPVDTFFIGTTGVSTGYYATAAWRQFSADGDYYKPDPYGVPYGTGEEPYGTWVYEVSVNRDALGLATGATITMSLFGVDCGNDYLSMSATVGPHGFVPPIPEPAGLGLIGLALMAARRRRK